jgi:hypothetical protein
MQARDHCGHKKNKTATELIRNLNDSFRQTLEGGHIILTDGVLSLETTAIEHILSAVQQFNDFNCDNDPYSEHDFGSIEAANERILWKIDYYDRRLEFGSPNPSDPSVTTRVLTIMLASEY